jgi:hypothetical protein
MQSQQKSGQRAVFGIAGKRSMSCSTSKKKLRTLPLIIGARRAPATVI